MKNVLANWEAFLSRINYINIAQGFLLKIIMKNVYLCTAAKSNIHDNHFSQSAYHLVKESAIKSKTDYFLVEDPAIADLIIFVETNEDVFLNHVRSHPIYQKYTHKCFIFSSNDIVIPLIPGIYASLSKKTYYQGRTRSGFYIHSNENHYLKNIKPLSEIKPTYLASFQGTIKNHLSRKPLLNINDPRIYIKDTSNQSVAGVYTSSDLTVREKFFSEYAALLETSQFILTPRGVGTSSQRLFEAMEAGRCPVIISDDWIEPEGPKWEECSIRIKEKNIHQIPQILNQQLTNAINLGKNAKNAWEQYFSPQNRFNTLVNNCLSIMKYQRIPENIFKVWILIPHLLKIKNLKIYLREKISI